MNRGNRQPIAKWCAEIDTSSFLSEFVREIKVGFTRYYDRRHNRRGYFWGDRFKSVIVEKGETLINCPAYIDLNPLRAGLVDRPEEYRWNSLGYHIQTSNKVDFLSLDFGLREFGIIGTKEFVSTNYQRFKDIFMSKKDTGLIPDILNEKSMVPRDRIELPTRGFSDLIFKKAEMA